MDPVDALLVLVFLGFILSISQLHRRSKISREENKPLTKQQQKDLITRKTKGRVHNDSRKIWVNKQDIKYTIITSRYEVSWQFAHMIPNRDYNGMSATQCVIDISKQEILDIRKMCKEKYNMDIHYELYGVTSENALVPGQQEREFNDALEEVLNKE